jgi:hypothetical protein
MLGVSRGSLERHLSGPRTRPPRNKSILSGAEARAASVYRPILPPRSRLSSSFSRRRAGKGLISAVFFGPPTSGTPEGGAAGAQAPGTPEGGAAGAQAPGTPGWGRRSPGNRLGQGPGGPGTRAASRRSRRLCPAEAGWLLPALASAARCRSRSRELRSHLPPGYHRSPPVWKREESGRERGPAMVGRRRRAPKSPRSSSAPARAVRVQLAAPDPLPNDPAASFSAEDGGRGARSSLLLARATAPPVRRLNSLPASSADRSLGEPPAALNWRHQRILLDPFKLRV